MFLITPTHLLYDLYCTSPERIFKGNNKRIISYLGSGAIKYRYGKTKGWFKSKSLKCLRRKNGGPSANLIIRNVLSTCIVFKKGAERTYSINQHSNVESWTRKKDLNDINVLKCCSLLSTSVCFKLPPSVDSFKNHHHVFFPLRTAVEAVKRGVWGKKLEATPWCES